MRAACVLTALALLAAAPAAAQEAGRYEVELSYVDDDPVLSVRAQEAPVEPMMRAIADSLKLELSGFERVAVPEPITVFLEQRPASSVIHWLLGSAGLRAQIGSERILVRDDTSPFPTRAELYEIAQVAFLRALRNHPEHEDAARTEMALAEIQEYRGDRVAAANHYDYVIEKHGGSELVPEALLRSGRHLARLGEWSEAAARFERLARLDGEHAFHTVARVELARALCFTDRPKRALHTLDALETYYPTEDPDERYERLLVRARALTLSDRPVDALRALDLAGEYSTEGAMDPAVMELRAMAIAAAGRPGEAAVAWMQFADEVDGAEKAAALEHAARMALESGDEVGVLFIDAWATDAGLGPAVDTYANEARVRLGLTPRTVSGFTDAQRLARAKDLFARGLTGEAREALEPLFNRRASLSDELRSDLARAYARALEADGLLEPALHVLRDVAGTLRRPEHKNPLFLLAAELLELHGQIGKALEAIQGRL